MASKAVLDTKQAWSFRSVKPESTKTLKIEYLQISLTSEHSIDLIGIISW